MAVVVRNVNMYGCLVTVLLATTTVQMALAELDWSKRKTSLPPVPMLIDEDDSYYNDICLAEPQLPPLDYKCLTSRVVGNNAIYVWYYNSTAKVCLQDVTADCPITGPRQAPSKNRFASFKECKRTCLNESSTEKPRNKQKTGGSRRQKAPASTGDQPCRGLPVTGTGQASVPSWYYDRSTDECAEFNYSGRGGNRNRFTSRSECVKQCKGRGVGGGSRGPTTESGSPATAGRAKTSAATVSRTSARRKTGGRQTTTPGLGNKCTDPPVTGTCGSATRSWYYDSIMADCIEFVYSGCGGGLNKHATRDACLKACKAPPSPASIRATDNDRFTVQTTNRERQSTPSSSTTPGAADIRPSRCSGRADPGPCRALMRRYYYSERDGTCHQFSYGGCGGTENRFHSSGECMHVCGNRKRIG